MDFAASAFEIKSLDDAGHIEGLAAGFGNVDHGGDKILHGAFTKTLAERGNAPLPMLLHHDLKRPIGSWKSWQETADGLYVKGQLTLSTRDAQEAHALAKDGALSGLSIGWKARAKPRFEGGARVLPEVDLFEASLVTVPMNDKGRVASVKTITSVRDIEELLQECGLSGRKAKAASSAAWKAINQADDDDAASAAIARLFADHTARLAAAGVR
jgi:HK97 family phage prohead protease